MKKLFVLILAIASVAIASVIATIISYGSYFTVIAQGDNAQECAEAAVEEATTFCQKQCSQQGYSGGTPVNCHGAYNPATETCRHTCNCKCDIIIVTTPGNF